METKTLNFNQLALIEGGAIAPSTSVDQLEWGYRDIATIGCLAGIAMVIASAGVNIAAFAVGVIAIDAYCGDTHFYSSGE